MDQKLHCHMFSLSLGNIVMSEDNGRNEPNLYVPCQLHALFSLLSISHDHLDALSSTVGCLSDPPINFQSVCRPCLSQQAKCKLAQAYALQA